MVHKLLLATVLVLLASSHIFSLEPKLLLFQPRMNTESLQLLNNLQISSIHQCLPHRKYFLLPQRSVTSHQHQTEHALAILHEILQQIFNLFGESTSLGKWEENHMDKFLTELHRQLEYLESLMGLATEQKSVALGSKSLRLQIKAYFRRIHNYLENQGYSRCAWIIVQVEIKRCLFFVFRLARRLCKQEMDP